MSKGLIHGEFGYFVIYVQILIELDNILRREIRKINIFGKKTDNMLNKHDKT